MTTTPLEQLQSVLCDPDGKCCIVGSDEDRATIDAALAKRQQITQCQKDLEKADLLLKHLDRYDYVVAPLQEESGVMSIWFNPTTTSFRL